MPSKTLGLVLVCTLWLLQLNGQKIWFSDGEWIELNHALKSLLLHPVCQQSNSRLLYSPFPGKLVLQAFQLMCCDSMLSAGEEGLPAEVLALKEALQQKQLLLERFDTMDDIKMDTKFNLGYRKFLFDDVRHSGMPMQWRHEMAMTLNPFPWSSDVFHDVGIDAVPYLFKRTRTWRNATDPFQPEFNTINDWNDKQWSIQNLNQYKLNYTFAEHGCVCPLRWLVVDYADKEKKTLVVIGALHQYQRNESLLKFFKEYKVSFSQKFVRRLSKLVNTLHEIHCDGYTLRNITANGIMVKMFDFSIVEGRLVFDYDFVVVDLSLAIESIKGEQMTREILGDGYPPEMYQENGALKDWSTLSSVDWYQFGTLVKEIGLLFSQTQKTLTPLQVLDPLAQGLIKRDPHDSRYGHRNIVAYLNLILKDNRFNSSAAIEDVVMLSLHFHNRMLDLPIFPVTKLSLINQEPLTAFYMKRTEEFVFCTAHFLVPIGGIAELEQNFGYKSVTQTIAPIVHSLVVRFVADLLAAIRGTFNGYELIRYKKGDILVLERNLTESICACAADNESIDLDTACHPELTGDEVLQVIQQRFGNCYEFIQ